MPTIYNIRNIDRLLRFDTTKDDVIVNMLPFAQTPNAPYEIHRITTGDGHTVTIQVAPGTKDFLLPGGATNIILDDDNQLVYIKIPGDGSSPAYVNNAGAGGGGGTAGMALSFTGANATVGTAYSGKLTATGGTAPYTYAIAAGSALPAGLTLDTTTGDITGTPTGPGGTVTFTASATDSSSLALSASRSFTIYVNSAGGALTLAFHGAVGSMGSQYQGGMQASGGVQPWTYSITNGSLPAGLTLDPTTGNITGVPTGPAGQTSTCTGMVTDATSATASATISIFITSPSALMIAWGGGNAAQGVPYNGGANVFGGQPPFNFAILPPAQTPEAGVNSGLPPGLTLNVDTGVISGTPTQSGQWNFQIQVTDTTAATAAAGVELVVASTAEGIAPFQMESLTAEWDVNNPTTLWTYVAVAPETTLAGQIPATGGHLYVEVPDTSTIQDFKVNITPVGSAGTSGPWPPIDCGKQVYVAAQQPWKMVFPLLNVPAAGISMRVYVVAYADLATGTVDPAPIKANQPNPTPSLAITVYPFDPTKPQSGVEYQTVLPQGLTASTGLVATIVIDDPGAGVTSITAAAVSSRTGQGAQLAAPPFAGGVITGPPTILAGGSGYKDGDPVNFTGTYTSEPVAHIEVETPDDNSTGKLITPVAVYVDLTNVQQAMGGLLPDNYGYEIWGVWDNDTSQTLIQLTGVEVANGLVPQGPDVIQTPHSITFDTPATSQGITLVCLSLVMMPGTFDVASTGGMLQINSYVPGVTPAVHVVIGAVGGTIDATQTNPSTLGKGLGGGAGSKVEVATGVGLTFDPNENLAVAYGGAIVDDGQGNLTVAVGSGLKVLANQVQVAYGAALVPDAQGNVTVQAGSGLQIQANALVAKYGAALKDDGSGGITLNVASPLAVAGSILSLQISGDFVVNPSTGQLTQNTVDLLKAINFNGGNFSTGSGQFAVNQISVNALIAGNAVFEGQATFAYSPSSGGYLVITSNGIILYDTPAQNNFATFIRSDATFLYNLQTGYNVQVNSGGVGIYGPSGSLTATSGGIVISNSSVSLTAAAGYIQLVNGSATLTLQSGNIAITNGNTTLYAFPNELELLAPNNSLTVTSGGIVITSPAGSLTMGASTLTMANGSTTLNMNSGNLWITNGTYTVQVYSYQIALLAANTSLVVTPNGVTISYANQYSLSVSYYQLQFVSPGGTLTMGSGNVSIASASSTFNVTSTQLGFNVQGYQVALMSYYGMNLYYSGGEIDLEPNNTWVRAYSGGSYGQLGPTDLMLQWSGGAQNHLQCSGASAYLYMTASSGGNAAVIINGSPNGYIQINGNSGASVSGVTYVNIMGIANGGFSYLHVIGGIIVGWS